MFLSYFNVDQLKQINGIWTFVAGAQSLWKLSLFRDKPLTLAYMDLDHSWHNWIFNLVNAYEVSLTFLV